MKRRACHRESPKRRRWESRLFVGATLAIIALGLAVAPPQEASPNGLESRGSDVAELMRVVGPLPDSLLSARSTVTWHGGVTQADDGHLVTVYVSDSYLGESNTPERWANFFSNLVHGAELPSASVYVSTPADIEQMCGPDAAGCFGFARLVIPGEPMGTVSPEEIARHEYGHHLALNRSNHPWLALDWGTKRWASYVGVCARATAGTLFPGNEGWGYRLNPGEGFAEAYRALNESRLGATTFTWTIVDGSFYPDATALRLLEQDVLVPWTAPRMTSLRVRFEQSGKRTWSRTVALPFDGSVAITATTREPSTYDVTLGSVDGKRQIGRVVVVNGRPGKLTYTACGTRSVLLRVVRKTQPGTITLRVTTP